MEKTRYWGVLYKMKQVEPICFCPQLTDIQHSSCLWTIEGEITLNLFAKFHCFCSPPVPNSWGHPTWKSAIVFGHIRWISKRVSHTVRLLIIAGLGLVLQSPASKSSALATIILALPAMMQEALIYETAKIVNYSFWWLGRPMFAFLEGYMIHLEVKVYLNTFTLRFMRQEEKHL